jgi:hypothetical protein
MSTIGIPIGTTGIGDIIAGTGIKMLAERLRSS